MGVDRDAKAVEPLIEALQASGLKNVNVRIDAAEALGKIGDPDAVESLIRAMEDSNVIIPAVKALGEIGSVEPKGALTQALEHKKKNVRKAAAEALEMIKEKEAGPA